MNAADTITLPWAKIFENTVLWGPGLLILFGIYLLMRRPPAFVGAFILAQQAQAVAMQQMATAVQTMATRADALEQIRMQKLDEILVGQQLVLSKFDSWERRMDHGSH
jgi:hypothetical protein